MTYSRARALLFTKMAVITTNGGFKSESFQIPRPPAVRFPSGLFGLQRQGGVGVKGGRGREGEGGGLFVLMS